MKFANAFAPTEEELREWASDPDAEYPEEMSQDWDLILAEPSYASTLITLACEDSPNRGFFLSCLYIISGDCIRTRVNELSINDVREAFKLIPEHAPEDVKLWKKRSDGLFNDPSLYNYDDWGWGDLAYDSDT